MPNWCNNIVVVRSNKENISKLNEFLENNNGKEWFNFFRPLPEELQNGDGWYQWSVENWGCKWNCDAQNWAIEEDGKAISFWFDSPWGPPIQLYEFISHGYDNDSWDVSATFHEEGMGFVGEFVEGYEDTYEYSDLESLEDIPEHLIDEWNLHEMLLERDEFDEDDENE